MLNMNKNFSSKIRIFLKYIGVYLGKYKGEILIHINKGGTNLFFMVNFDFSLRIDSILSLNKYFQFKLLRMINIS